MPGARGTKTIVEHRKAFHEYELLEHLETGLVLSGTEVKSIRQGQVNLKDSYVRIKKGEAYVIGMHVSPYEQGNRFNRDPLRDRKLLLHRREIDRLFGRIQQDGLTLVPVRLYWKDGRVKLDIALARGKKLHDKRQAAAKRDSEREIRRTLQARHLP